MSEANVLTQDARKKFNVNPEIPYGTCRRMAYGRPLPTMLAFEMSDVSQR
jgi:hypothetical protein